MLSVTFVQILWHVLHIFKVFPLNLNFRGNPGGLHNLTNLTATRAITIDGQPADIFPWLLQMGYGRAGFYGYDLMENLGSPRGLQSAERILPQFQSFQVGDEVPISPVSQMVFAAIEPHEYVVWAGEGGGSQFTWALYTLNETQTRLVSRIRWSYHWEQPGTLLLEFFTEFADHLAVRKLVQGIKGRVEGDSEPLLQNSLELVTLIIAGLLFPAALVGLIVRKLTWERWLLALAAGFIWLLTWYGPTPWLGIPLTIAWLWGVRGAARRAR